MKGGGLSEFRALCKAVYNDVNKGKKRKISTHQVLEVIAILTRYLLDEEQGLKNLHTMLDWAKKRKYKAKYLYTKREDNGYK